MSRSSSSSNFVLKETAPSHTSHHDGSSLTKSQLEVIRNCQWRHCKAIQWSKGDLLVSEKRRGKLLMTDLLFLRSLITMLLPMGELDLSHVQAEILLLACSSEMSQVFVIYLFVESVIGWVW